MRTKNILLGLVLLSAFLLRTWHLDANPPHLTADEAALGYNAYSILTTGKDEYGRLLPMVFESFGDFKPGLYVYLTVPFIAVFGLTEFAVRLPSAIFGAISVFLVYLLVGKLLKGNKEWGNIDLIAATIVALNPWHIYFSRGAWEANIALTFTLLAINAFLETTSSYKKWIVFFGAIGLSLLSYQGSKLSTLIPVGVLVYLYRDRLSHINTKHLFVGLLTLFVFSLPIAKSVFTGQAGRLEVFSVFSYRRPDAYLNTFLQQGSEHVGQVKYYLYHSETGNFIRGIMGRWFNHFSTRFLFFEGDWQNLRHSAPNTGVLTLADLPLLALGLFVFANNLKRKEIALFGLWLILAPLPAALSRDQVHAVRSLAMSIPLSVIIAFGLNFLIAKFGKRFVFVPAIMLIYGVSYLFFLDAYFVHLPTHNARYWYYGYRQVVESVLAKRSDLPVKVQQSYDQPYIYFLFYGAAKGLPEFQPASYQKEAILTRSGPDVGLVKKVGGITFDEINWQTDKKIQGILVGDRIKIPVEEVQASKSYDVLSLINYPTTNEVRFIVLEVK